MALELCSRCNGSGQDGRCDVCGGSGFVDKAVREKPFMKASTHLTATQTSALPHYGYPRTQPKKSKKRSAIVKSAYPETSSFGKELALALVLIENSVGLTSKQLEFPTRLESFDPRIVLNQIKKLRAQYPDVESIKWSNFTCFVATLSDQSAIACVNVGGKTT